MTIMVIGATGFIGQALIRKLLSETSHDITAFSKSANRLDFGVSDGRVHKVAGDIFDTNALQSALNGVDVAIYLVHMMGAPDDYAELEAKAARQYVTAAKQARVKRTIFLGGLGDSNADLSKHLASRQRTGEILRTGLPVVIEFRASMIIGPGSVAFDIIKAIADKLPVVAVPRWAQTPTQPIGLADMLIYLSSAITIDCPVSQVVQTGGPDVLTYRQILEHYTGWAGHKQHVFVVPFVPRWAATWWLNHYMPRKDAGIGREMVDSLRYPMIVTDDSARRLFPTVIPKAVERSF